ncbi:hypothetical protein [Nocardioides sp. YIM 152588]|uniref:hypothetical protein n=1 Tax=Nocardioides sp. YIM 152588 TaxID=3158259 RepID=UPI0032E4E600
MNAPLTALRRHVTSGRVGLVLGLFALVVALGLPSQASTDAAPAARAAASPKAIKVFGAARTNNIDDFTEPTFTPIVAKKFRTAKGYLAITATVAVQDDASFSPRGQLNINLRVDGKKVIKDPFGVEVTNLDDGTGSIGTITAAVPVEARRHTVQLVARETGGGSHIHARQLSIVYTPQGSAKNIPVRPVAERDLTR